MSSLFTAGATAPLDAALLAGGTEGALGTGILAGGLGATGGILSPELLALAEIGRASCRERV